MAVRGINPLEKHVEKIFLALAAAGLTGVVAWQVAGGSGTVKVGTEDVPADQAYGKLESKAKSLTAQMREPNPATPEKLKQSRDLRAEFQQRLAGGVSPSPSIAGIVMPGLNFGEGAGPIKQGDQFYLPPVLPMALKPIAHAFMSTVHEGDITTYQDLAKFMPAKAPFDKAAVSVETTIDPKAIRAVLESDPDGAGPAQPLLRNWWAGTEVVAVELVRQEQKPDGTWGGEVATAVLPGRTNFVQALADPQIDSQRLLQVAYDAAAASEDILRPDWYRRAELGSNAVGEEWVSPRKAAKADEAVGGGPLDELQKKLRDQMQRKSQLEKRISDVQAQPARPPVGGGGGGGAGGGGGGGRRPSGPGGGGGGGGGGGSAPRPDPKEEQIKSLQRALEQVNATIADLEKKISELGGKADTTAAKPVVKDADLSVLLSGTEPVTVWHHDIEATRGATYRYQIRVKINNPLFNRPMQLPADKVAEAKNPTLTVPCADWSDPVHVDDDVYCFITSANAGANNGGTSGLGNAQATLLYFTWGYWRGTNLSLEPGDGMVARWTVPDETKINAAPAPSAVPPPVAPAPGGGGRRPAAIGGGGGLAPAAPAPPAAGAPVGTPLPTKEVTKERDAFLLDVIANPVTRTPPGGGSPKVNFLALIRDIDKSIVALDPEIERASALFRRLEASVQAGRDQLKGVASAAPGPVGGVPAPVPPPTVNPRGSGG